MDGLSQNIATFFVVHFFPNCTKGYTIGIGHQNIRRANRSFSSGTMMVYMWYWDIGMAFNILHSRHFAGYPLRNSVIIRGSHIFRFEGYSSNKNGVVGIVKMKKTDEITGSR